ncbi:MAG: hypothetical protein K0U68_03890 [Gammaproteobacteria bacterium]|nr:hypothetical protein [Gammaproteobacteria bacterium]
MYRSLLLAHRLLSLVTVGLLFNSNSLASVIDNDFYCRTYGCVMMSDGVGTDVYDVYIFATGGTVAIGNPLISWSGNPINGAGTVSPVETGTITPVPSTLPGAGNGTRLAIDTNGNGAGDIAIADNNSNGYLDAADSVNAFSITGSTDIVYQGNTVAHSFYLTSRNTAHDLRARSFVNSAVADYGTAVGLPDISFAVSTTQTGNDAGISYGARANNGGFTPVAGINDLGDINGIYTSIALFTRNGGIRQSPDNANTHVYNQSIRFNMNYGYPVLDLSQGDGTIQFRVEYTPYKL